MEPTYFEVIFSKRWFPQNEYWTVYIELDGRDMRLLRESVRAEFKTFLLVDRAGVLDLLPTGLNSDWTGSGSVLEHEIIGSSDGGVEPTISKSGHRVWIIPGG